MTTGFDLFSSTITLMLSLGALAMFMLGVWYFWDRSAAQPEIDRLRRTLERTASTDPQYDTARQMYAIGALAAAWARLSPSEKRSPSGGDQSDSHSDSHSDSWSSHAGDGGSSGGDGVVD